MSSSQPNSRLIIDRVTAGGKPLSCSAESAFLVTKNSFTAYEKPCEDYCLLDTENGVFIVMDGCPRIVRSGNYPSPSPGLEAAKIVAESIRSAFIEHTASGCSKKEALWKAVVTANDRLGQFNRERFPEPDLLENDLAAALGIAAVLDGSTLRYIYAGDPYGFVVSGDTIRQFTTPQTSGFESVIADLRNQGKTSQEEIQKVLYGELRNRPHPHGFGAFTGEEHAAKFFESGQIEIRSGDRLLLCTDGFEPLLKYSPEIIKNRDLRHLTGLAEELERREGLRSDDKSILSVEFVRDLYSLNTEKTEDTAAVTNPSPV